MYAPAGVKTNHNEFPIPDTHEGLGARRSGRAQLHRQAGAGAEARRGAGAHRRGRDLRDRSRNHLSRPAGLDPGRLPFNKNFTPGHEYMGTVVALGPGVDEYKIGQRVAGRDPRRLRPVQALPRGHVHLLPQLRPQLRRRRQGPPRQRLHHRRRLLRIPGQQHQHAGRDPRRRCRTRKRRWSSPPAPRCTA